MAYQVLNPQSEKELTALGFAKTELDRIKANDLLVRQINGFAAKGGKFPPTDIPETDRIIIMYPGVVLSEYPEAV